MKIPSPPGDVSDEPGASTPSASGAPASGAASPGAAESGASPKGGPAPDDSADHPLRDAAARVAEIVEYITYYFATRNDQFKLAAREAFFFGVAVLVVFIAIGALIVVAAVLL